jgi:hypothetical protein
MEEVPVSIPELTWCDSDGFDYLTSSFYLKSIAETRSMLSEAACFKVNLTMLSLYVSSRGSKRAICSWLATHFPLSSCFKMNWVYEESKRNYLEHLLIMSANLISLYNAMRFYSLL